MMLSLILTTALAAGPLPDKYVRLACTETEASEPLFVLDMPTLEYTKLYRGVLRRLYHMHGEDGTIWDVPVFDRVVDGWPDSVFLSWTGDKGSPIELSIVAPDDAIAFTADTGKNSGAALCSPNRIVGSCELSGSDSR